MFVFFMFAKFLVTFLLFLLLPFYAYAESLPHGISSFSTAKKIAAKVYHDQNESFYCGCRFDGKVVDPAECGYQPRKNAKRGARIEWEHVVPAHAFGHTRECWREAICTNSKGERYKGRRCCKKIDPVFRAMEADLQNLVPAVGELNGDRANYSFNMIEGEPRAYGEFDFEVDFKRRVTEPRAEVRGDIARIYFYMRDSYGLPISRKQHQLFEVWDRQDPISEWEIERQRRILDAISR